MNEQTPLTMAREFVRALQDRDGNAAALLCATNVEILLPGATAPIRGHDGLRRLLRSAPDLVHTIKREEETAKEVRVTTLTRAPGILANYTTWHVETSHGTIRRVSFDLKPAN